MIHTDRAIVVEGKYDKIKLSSMVDGVIICTGGFRVYKDKEMQAMLRALAKKQGLAVLTDSDTAGFKIRGFLRSICGKENINSKSNSRKYSNCIDYKRISVIIILYYTDDNEY